MIPNTNEIIKHVTTELQKAIREQVTWLVTAVRPPDTTTNLVNEIVAQVVNRLPPETAKPQVTGKRHWTPEQKRRILAEAGAAKASWGGVQKVCDKYRITSAHLTQWKHQLFA